MSDMNTQFRYGYRDASNYKASEEVVVIGELRARDLAPFLESISEGTEFIPSQVGLEDLQPRMRCYPSADDHVWHQLEMDSFRFVDRLPTLRLTAAELVENFKGASGNWDVVAACKKHGFIV